MNVRTILIAGVIIAAGWYAYKRFA